ncbi:hypothetical protein D9619_007306 [Psilocybe cf. subviscida]|uniref:Sas10 C-terminal domain-containing protein n=1 Tax=Psilocybe cf. subviscida TaxID=2480587 RepID=A0A8H5B1U1_9AGAR|nr:hypothetical protein D9619_007306 [Psilocybe cf. subviscida]
MVRRRSTKKDHNAGSKPKPLKRSDGKMKKWETIGDIPMDEEDQFHHNRDKILLDGNSREMMDDEDDEEVFALKGMEGDSDSDDGVPDYDEEEEEDYPMAEEDAAPKKEKKKSKKDKKAKGKNAVDEEDEEEQGEEEEESWGKGRGAYYSSNADQLESDDDEGNELEEQESKRLQIKAREELNDDDFGLNDNPETENQDEAKDVLDAVPTVLPPPTTDKRELLKHLEKTSPESLALARDWDQTARSLQKAKAKVEKVQTESPDALSLGMLHLHYQALLSYSTMLAFYLHMRASAKYAQRPHLLKSHPILQRLLVLKQSLSTLEDLDFAGDDSDEEDEDDDEDAYSMDSEQMQADREMLWSMDHDSDADGDEADSVDFDSDELAELMKDAKMSLEEGPSSKPPKKKQKIQAQEESSSEEEEDTPAKSKSKKKSDKKSEKKNKLVTPVFDLVEPEFVSSKPSSHRTKTAPGDDVLDAFGESTALHSVDAADKTARKKSLRFHTSKIESASARRQGARNQAAGGDDDIPYRERKSAKEARLVKEAAIKAQNQVGAPLDDEEPEPKVGQKRPRDEEDEGGESPDEYYELVKNKSKEKKIKKKEEYEAAARERIMDDSEVSGPRSLTRAILANKGLTPHRPKAVRNPRVKKRQKFEKAKKKLASQKATYKGGLSAVGGKYAGESSGISKVVKSVPLG